MQTEGNNNFLDLLVNVELLEEPTADPQHTDTLLIFKYYFKNMVTHQPGYYHSIV